MLSNAKVTRKGETARYWVDATTEVELDTNYAPTTLNLKFKVPSKGGGISVVKVVIGKEDFAVIASTMTKVDRKYAIAAMAASLASELELEKQFDYDNATELFARSSVFRAAKKAVENAPSGNNDAEVLTMNRVKRLVDELNNRTEKGTPS